MRVGVIGSGLAGLAAACTLAARGHEVEVFEKNAWLGGKAAQLRERGLSVRYGADDSDSAVGAAQDLCRGGEEARGLRAMVRLDPQWRCFFDDGATIDLLDDEATMSAELETLSRGWAANISS
jgi:diapolycopene oxygenase